MKNLGTVLRKWRMMSEISVRDAAKTFGINPSTLIRLELNKGGISGTTVARIMKWFFAE